MSSGFNDGNEVALDPTVDFIAGTVAGIASLVVGFPFDTVKVRFQNPVIAHRYTSTFHAITTIIREERFLGLFKGITSPLATVALMNGLVFSSYRFFMKLQLENNTSIPTLAQIALAGAGSGIVCSIITTPTELIKIRQQSMFTQTTARQVTRQILRESGMAGLYRGITATAIRDSGYGAYFFAYEATCRLLTPKPSHGDTSPNMGKLTWPALLLAGGVAGVIGWFATFPFDVVKTRVQGSNGFSGGLYQSEAEPLLKSTGYSVTPTSNPYRTTLSTIVNSYRDEGASVFFKGLAPTLIRAIPVNMAMFATFEAVVHFLS